MALYSHGRESSRASADEVKSETAVATKTRGGEKGRRLALLLENSSSTQLGLYFVFGNFLFYFSPVGRFKSDARLCIESLIAATLFECASL